LTFQVMISTGSVLSYAPCACIRWRRPGSRNRSVQPAFGEPTPWRGPVPQRIDHHRDPRRWRRLSPPPTAWHWPGQRRIRSTLGSSAT